MDLSLRSITLEMILQPYRSRYPNSYLVFEVTENTLIAVYFIMLDVCPATENETANLNLKHKKESETNLTPLSHIHPLYLMKVKNLTQLL